MEYTLRFPFEISPGREISGAENDFEFKLLGYPSTLSKSGEYFVIKASQIPTEREAKALATKLWSGLAWLLLQRDIGFSANTHFDKVVYSSDPNEAGKNIAGTFGLSDVKPIDVLINAGFPSVYPSEKRIMTLGGGKPSVIISTPADLIVESISHGTSASNALDIPTDTRLRTALDLYSSHFYEVSSNARLLTLTMVLEALTVPRKKVLAIQKLLDKWESELSNLISSAVEGSEDHEGYLSLKRELIFRRDLSIRSQVRAMVQETLEKVGNEDSKLMADNARDAYDIRSKLIHEGSSSEDLLSDALKKAKVVSKMVLEANFKGFH